ncbi:hypothetical protein GCM10027432_18350 [Lysobacter fragariae]
MSCHRAYGVQHRYPARDGGNGRRAREVMPAAIQAEVITSAAAQVDFMRARMLACMGGWRNPGLMAIRNQQDGAWQASCLDSGQGA